MTRLQSRIEACLAMLPLSTPSCCYACELDGLTAANMEHRPASPYCQQSYALGRMNRAVLLTLDAMKKDVDMVVCPVYNDAHESDIERP